VADDEASRLETAPQQQKKVFATGMLRVVDQSRVFIKEHRLSVFECDLMLTNIGQRLPWVPGESYIARSLTIAL